MKAKQMEQKIETVKALHELEWMQLEGVEGVGIQEQNHKEVIVVYVSRSKKDLLRHLPQKVGGYQVVMVDAGEFTAL